MLAPNTQLSSFCMMDHLCVLCIPEQTLYNKVTPIVVTARLLVTSGVSPSSGETTSSHYFPFF